MKSLILLISLFGSLAIAGDQTFQSLTDIATVVRDPVFSTPKRLEYLEFTHQKMVSLLSKELDVPEKELNLTFMKSPVKANILMTEKWYDLQTEFYTSIHMEQYNQRWNELQKFVKFSDYGKSINATMLAHLGNYSPVMEGRYYLRWHKIGINSEGRTRNFNIPYFLMSKKIRDLVSLEAHVPYEELIKENDLPTFIGKTSGMTRVQRQELAEKMELNRRINQRAVANAAKTVASIHFLTGLNNLDKSETRVSVFLDRYCESCTAKEKKEALKGSMSYVSKMKKYITYQNTSDVANKFCTSLKKHSYHWNIDKLKPTPLELYLNNSKIIDYYTVHKLKKKNVEAIAKAILDQDLGILFITNAMTLLDKLNEPIGTKLSCTKATEAVDAELVRQAIEEAEVNIAQYLARVSKKVREAQYNLPLTNSALEYFVQTNQASSIEATSSYPQGIGWVLKSLAELDQNMSRRSKTDSVIMWGGTILGVGLTLTGIGAPEGVSIMIAAMGVVKGLAAGSYYFVRSSQEKEFAKEMQFAKNGGAEMSQENLKKHYSDYKTLKIYYIKEFGQSALNFMNLHRMVMNKTGDVGKTHSLLRRVFETAKEEGKGQAVDVVQELVLQIAVQS